MKKIKCNICSSKFYPEKSKVYEVTENSSLTAAITSGTKRYNAIDCPYCGCQKILWTRLLEVKHENISANKKSVK